MLRMVTVLGISTTAPGLAIALPLGVICIWVSAVHDALPRVLVAIQSSKAQIGTSLLCASR